MAFGTRPFPAGRPSSGRAGRDGRAAEGAAAESADPTADPVEVARQICLHQLEFRPRTRAELAGVLTRKGVDPDVAEQVLARFTEVGMIDDAAFAQLWVTSRHRGKGLAGRALSAELRRKGVADDDAATAVATLDAETELATARALVERRLRTTTGLATDARVRRLAGMLARKGYPAGLAFRVVREALAAEGEAAELAFDDLQALDDLTETDPT